MMRPRPLLATLVLLAALGCGRETHDHSPASEAGESWSVTAWGDRYEVFAECGPLIAGATATCNAHVTVLDGFKPLTSGVVGVSLGGSGSGQVFRQEQPKRDGIYAVEVRPAAEGAFDLKFEVEGPAGPEDIAAGSVTVGNAESPGGAGAGQEGVPDAISFLKEQQWRTSFATARVSSGSIHESVSCPGRVSPSAGGEVTLTAAFDAAVAPDPWPYPGLDVVKGRTVMRLLPRVGERSLPDLQADAAALAAEVEAARNRADRLAELLRLEATSAAELERARATLSGLEARLRSARQGADAAAGAGSPPDGERVIGVNAPWTGRVAEVLVSPGQTVAAGTALARLVKMRPLWIVLSLRPEDAARVEGSPSGLLVRRPGSSEILEVGAAEVRLVSRSPEVDRETASIGLIVEVDRSASELPIGSSVEAELLLAGERRGLVVPASALIDDSGVVVAYVQTEGESFARREVRVIARQGDQALVEGLAAGDWLVTVGGGAIRRSSLLSSGAPEGHVH
jgi:membrane fusion protein, heavy metal efflux system